MRTLRNSPQLRGLARNPALPPHLLKVMLAAADDRLRPLLEYWGDWDPEDADQPPADIGKLLRSLRYRDVRRQVARHPDVPVETLVELLGDDDRQVAESAAANPALPECVMAELLGA